MTISKEDLDAIGRAVEAVAHRLQPEDRWDLRQDLAIQLWRRRKRPRDVEAWARRGAQTWTINFKVAERRERELAKELRDTSGTGRGYRVGPAWQPPTFPPHAGECEHLNAEGEVCRFAPLACDGTRVMHVKS